MAAGITNIKVTQLQFFPNQLLKVLLRKRIRTIETRGGFFVAAGSHTIVCVLLEKIKRNSQVAKFIVEAAIRFYRLSYIVANDKKEEVFVKKVFTLH